MNMGMSSGRILRSQAGMMGSRVRDFGSEMRFGGGGSIGRTGMGMMAGGAALIGGAAMLSHRHRQRARSSGGMM